MGKKLIGNTDKPICDKKEDGLGVEKYIKGLSKFIQECETPMTIAIQGDWGSGKTSFMNMINNTFSDEKSKHVLPVWFNTWQFSQFSMESSLAVVFIEQLIDEIKSDTEIIKCFKEKLRVLKKVALNAGNTMLEDKLGINVQEAMGDAPVENMASLITSLRSDFQKCVDESLAKKNAERLVVFVDDLDRLAPGRAVELLEVLKLFLDCESCVFVLAIDYEVVSRGISEKYGKEFGEKKGKSFFDKIIQVPFKMPVAQYQISKYIADVLKNMKFANENVNMYEELIANSIGNNPRGMKRMFNALLMQKMVYGDEKLNSARKQLLLFAVLCLQMSFENIYNFIIMDDEVDIAWFDGMSKSENEADREAFYFKYEDCYDVEEVKAFMDCFLKIVLNEKESLQETDYKELLDILNMSSTTSTGLAKAGNGKSGKAVRYSGTYDENYALHPISEYYENKKSFNSCIVENYQIAEQIYDSGNKIKFVDIFRNAIQYAYLQKPEAFAKLREACENGTNTQKVSSAKLLFFLEQGEDVAHYVMEQTGWKIGIRSSNDLKIAQMNDLYIALGLDPKLVKLNMKYFNLDKEAGKEE